MRHQTSKGDVFTGEKHPLPVSSVGRTSTASWARPANTTPYDANDAIGRDAGIAQVETATAVGTISEPAAQEETLSVVASITVAGDASLTVESSLLSEPVVLTFPVEESDDENAVAAAARAALLVSSEITAHYAVSGEDEDVILTALVPAEDDTDLSMSIDNDTCEGITAGSSTTTVSGSPDGTGDALVTVTGADIPGSPLAIPVAVEAGDTASEWAAKVRAALSDVGAITGLYTVGGTSANISLTRKVPAADDTTLNIALTNGSSLGITEAPTSTNTTSGSLTGTIAGSAIFEFADIGPKGGSVVVTGVDLRIDVNAVPSGMTGGFRLYIYGEEPTAILDNAAWDFVTGDRGKLLGYIDIGAPADLGSTLFRQDEVVKQFQLKAGSTSLWGVLVTKSGFTPGSSTAYTLNLHTLVA